MKKGTSYRGVALLIVLGVLALLSVIALAFVSLSRLERQVSRNYVDHVRAQLTAESGVEAAVARIAGAIGTPDPAFVDWMAFGKGEAPSISLQDTRHPSFAADLDGNGVLNLLDFRNSRFEDLDPNGDGVITRLEWRKARKSFDLLDQNSDGKISPDEYLARQKAFKN